MEGRVGWVIELITVWAYLIAVRWARETAVRLICQSLARTWHAHQPSNPHSSGSSTWLY